jgi:DNA-binding MarR family transcriptional regulator
LAILMPSAADAYAPHDPAVLAESLRPTFMRVSRRLRQESLKAGVSAFDAVLLGRIRLFPGVGICELADSERISRPTMSAHIKRLVAEGWVEKVEDREDGRRSGLSLTPAGQRRIENIRRRRNDWLAARLANLSPEARAAIAEAVIPLSQLVDLEL